MNFQALDDSYVQEVIEEAAQQGYEVSAQTVQRVWRWMWVGDTPEPPHLRGAKFLWEFFSEPYMD